MEEKMPMERENRIEAVQISFCLPVFNVKPYLNDCIDSIAQSELGNISYEILCIDDGSIDGSYEYLLEMQHRTHGLRVLKNEINRGVSFTRNRLMQEAKGDYIWFVDPDDMVTKRSANAMLATVKHYNADIVLANYHKIEENYCGEIPCAPEHFSHAFVETDTFCWLPDKDNESKMFSACRGIFRRSFLLRNELYFNEAISFMEDSLFYYEWQQKKPRVVKCEFSCYLVRQRQNSAMRSDHAQKRMNAYFSGLALYLAYKKHLDNHNYISLSDLNARILSARKETVFRLSMVEDFSFVRKELKKLIKMKIFPLPAAQISNKRDKIARSKVSFYLGYVLRRIKRYILGLK